MIKNIKNLYNQLEDKKAFIGLCANEFKRTEATLYCNWFSGFWSIPEKYQDRVLTLLKKNENDNS